MRRRSGAATAPHAGPAPRRAPAPTIDLDAAGSTPILREYRAVKAEHAGAIVLARLGDFYEMFGEDAEVAAPLLGVTLTGRGFGSAGRLPMCGVPHHSTTQHVRRLLAAGHRVVLWDQVGGPDEDGGGPRTLVRREVTRILTPGTLLDDDFLEPATAVRCVALAPRPGRVGIAALDASTGDLQLAEWPGGLDAVGLTEELDRLAAAELLVPEGQAIPEGLAPSAPRTRLPGAHFDPGRGSERLHDLAGVATLRGLGADGLPAAHAAAAALLSYCERSRIALDRGFVRVHVRALSEGMRLDAPTRRNLEITTSPGGAGGLAGLLDRTMTPMGARLLRDELLLPLTSAATILSRLDAVDILVRGRDGRRSLRDALRHVRDLERLCGRCVQRLASPRDLVALAAGLAALDGVRAAVGDLAGEAGPTGELLTAAAADATAPDGLADRLLATLVDDPPPSTREGGAIRPGADAVLDSLVAAGAGAREYIGSLEDVERVRTGIRSLRVGFNRVFGYYLEVPNAHRAAVPGDWVRKQTLVGAERYITDRLREQEAVVLGSRDRAVAREAEILSELAAAAAAEAPAILRAAAGAARLDLIQSLATVADEQGWTRPLVGDHGRLLVEAGRHPLVERSLAPGAFVPNDCALSAGDGTRDAARILLVTGPNMAGKSTYLRQVAIIVLLAQVGSFVPARRAEIGVCDRIFTRVGAQDDIAGGLSTFMVEMTETAAILNQAGPRSLVVLDEIGRGTSTYDGLSIAQAVVEHLHDAPHLRCRTLFATHYHELTALAARHPGVRNARVEVVEDGDSVTFLHRIVEGGADRSYGIHVARLAGIPSSVVQRARAVLAELEAGRPLGPAARSGSQLALPLDQEAAPHPVVDELGRIDVDGLTPLEALNKLAELRARVSEARPPA